LTLKHRKLFLFNLANAYFLVGNYEDAKRRYSECLESQPGSDLKAKAYNNLALACWWSKNPLVAEQQVQPAKHRGSSVDSDFKQAKGLFLKAIEAAENPNLLADEQERYALRQAIAEYELDLNAKFTSGETVLPMYNLAQFYIHNEPTERVKILYWLRALLKLAQNHGSPLFDEAYTTLCLLGNEREELVKLLPEMLKKYAGKTEEVYYAKVAAFLRNGEGKSE
jgi:tetratricopeptide (TPR) repeat protein